VVDGGNIRGVTTTSLTITNVHQTNAGSYTVLVSNTNGSALSAEAYWTVGIPGTAIGSYTIKLREHGLDFAQWRLRGNQCLWFECMVLVRHPSVRLQLHGL